MIVVGCCGFPISRTKYFKIFRAVELQNTFYDNPTREEAQKIRNALPEEAIVTMKAWQALTHPHTSPTWKRMKRKPPSEIVDKVGMLRPTRENLLLWEEVKEVAKILKAEFVVFQTPPSMGYSLENYKNALEFFCRINRDSPVAIGWEPRGTWHEYPEAIKDIVDKCRIVHVVDILRRDPVIASGQRIVYIRLHGLGGRGEVNYRYKYTDEDLKKLLDKVLKLEEAGIVKTYVYFNNIYMFDDAKRFVELARSKCKEIGCEVV